MARHITTRAAAAPDPDLEVRHLRAFVAVVEQGSVSSAANVLGLAQSTVSEAIAALERALGSAVLQRQPGLRSARLTAAGEALLPHARSVLDAIGEAVGAVTRATNLARGAVEIVANESVSTYVLPDVLAEARARWPNTRFAVSVSTCADVRRGVADGEFDLGLLMDFPARRAARDDGGRSVRPIDREVVVPDVELVTFVAPGHPLIGSRARTPLPRSALLDYPVFVSDAAGDFRVVLDRFFRGDGLPRRALHATGTVEGVKKGVLSNKKAIGVLPVYAIDEELRAGRIVRLALRPALSHAWLVALRSRTRFPHPAIAQLVEGVRTTHRRSR